MALCYFIIALVLVWVFNFQ